MLLNHPQTTSCQSMEKLPSAEQVPGAKKTVPDGQQAPRLY